MILSRSILTTGGRSSKVQGEVHFQRTKSIRNIFYGRRSFPVLNFNIAVRTYARMSKRPRVQENTETEIKEPNLSNFTETEKQARAQQTQQLVKEEDVATEKTLTPAIKAHLRKVYGTVLQGIGMSLVGGVISAYYPILWLPSLIGYVIGVIALPFINTSRVKLRYTIFYATTTMVGMTLGPILSFFSPGITVAAILGTTSIFGAFTLMALKAKNNSMLIFGGPIFAALLLVCACSMAGLLLPIFGVVSPAVLGPLYSINIYGGLTVFSLFISLHTHLMIKDFKNGKTDHILPALDVFLFLYNIFLRLLEVFSSGG